ncbi:MAG: DUF3782 domain-containing protein [Magnetococcales bacterium]|nr:DUF3782 domain-containing protein [Magnetococcales bacterium]MBF0154616.1 DUF3782 domain-containing protein [Magnetococcales bacterium]MBF0308744.1 DUF3782 domain-containing protein [Magnetococcales bacterium]
MEETAHQMKETERQMKETDRQMKETERQMKETDRKMEETDRKLKENTRVGDNLTGKWGWFLEWLVAPACERVFAERGVPVHEVHQRVRKRTTDGRTLEVDILVVNENTVVLVEVKSSLGVPDVRRHLKRLARFKEFFPRYGDCRVMGAVIGIDTEERAEEFARNEGLFVLTHSGEDIRIANPAGFVPRVW